MQQDKDFWFDDGNIILIARGIGFRVHQGIIARHSTAFHDLFTVPQSQNEEKILDCSFVQLSDSPSDLRCLLRVLYDGKKYLFAGTKVEFSDVAALVRLAQKYQIEDLRDEALDCLKTYYTDEFAVWEVGMSRRCNISNMNVRMRDAVAAVNLARLTDTISILPVALYLCCLLPSHLLLRGIRREDGEVEKLSMDDLERCLEARMELLKANLTRISKAYSPVYSDYQRADCYGCVSMMDQLLAFHNQAVTGPFQSCRILLTGGEHDDDSVKLHACTRCTANVKAVNFTARQEIWGRLPNIMRLKIPTWGTKPQLNNSA
ncbi:hypothetical protein BKA93DRAFT_738634 [Sparassis latifolia]|uniref:BTB domain-containing protein n=1 Tax=Sparassis crispa TaxID=139825 RepID=A0A401H443_9APHY|nr:hypothetical protein SCP_1501810 [Sparassis crispa]GBE89173.1 hypothetical protein SCP_1501810 [Sparassis crispa]